jgi:hypothetical protein
VTQHGPVATRKDSTEEVTLAGELGVAAGVHAVVDPVELPCPEPVVDRAITKSERGQLAPADHRVLAPGERCHA